ncbi:J domain-containing protein, partial [Spirochaetota bacterium]
IMNISEYYKILNVNENVPNEVITSTFKKLAHKYHPDKNRDRVDWANKAMTNLNIAYSRIMSHRFKNESPEKKLYAKNNYTEKKSPEETDKAKARKKADYYVNKITSEILENSFIKFRESAKDALYRYFQYSLDNFHIRDKISNRGTFNRIVFSLRKSYHSIGKLTAQTDDSEFLEHFNVFSQMIFDFYRSSECINIIDSYKNILDVKAYRLYKTGDEELHKSHKEIFYERHNRGFFKKDIAIINLLKAEDIFKTALNYFPQSSWAVEIQIKLDYVNSLKKYVKLFFSEE